MKKTIFLITLFISFFCSTRLWAVEFSEVIELRVDNPYLSPNADGIKDNLFFTPVLKSEWDVTRWRLEINSKKGKTVYRVSGADFPTLIRWEGNDRKGNKLPEGAYGAVLLAWGPG